MSEGVFRPTDPLLNVYRCGTITLGNVSALIREFSDSSQIFLTPRPCRQLGHHQIITVASSNVDGEVLSPLLSDRQKQNHGMCIFRVPFF